MLYQFMRGYRIARIRCSKWVINIRPIWKALLKLAELSMVMYMCKNWYATELRQRKSLHQ